MKNKKKLGFLTVALATAFVAGCSDEVTNADRSFSDDRDYYMPFLNGDGGASATFKSELTTIDGVTYLDCELLNPDAVYVTLGYGPGEQNWVLAEALSPSNFCLATTGGQGTVSAQGRYHHYIPNASQASVAVLGQDALTANEDETYSFPTPESSWANDEFLNMQIDADLGFAASTVSVAPHPTDPTKSLYWSSDLGYFQPATGAINIGCFCSPVAVLESGNILAVHSEAEAFGNLFPSVSPAPTSNLVLLNADGSFDSYVAPRDPLSINALRPKFGVQIFTGRHYADGVWIAGMGKTTPDLTRIHYDVVSGEGYVARSLGNPGFGNSSSTLPSDVVGVFDGAGNLWILARGEDNLPQLFKQVSLGREQIGEAIEIEGFAQSLSSAGLSYMDVKSSLVTGN